MEDSPTATGLGLGGLPPGSLGGANITTTTCPSTHQTTTYPPQHHTTTYPPQHQTTAFPPQHQGNTGIPLLPSQPSPVPHQTYLDTKGPELPPAYHDVMESSTTSLYPPSNPDPSAPKILPYNTQPAFNPHAMWTCLSLPKRPWLCLMDLNTIGIQLKLRRVPIWFADVLPSLPVLTMYKYEQNFHTTVKSNWRQMYFFDIASRNSSKLWCCCNSRPKSYPFFLPTLSTCPGRLSWETERVKRKKGLFAKLPGDYWKPTYIDQLKVIHPQNNRNLPTRSMKYVYWLSKNVDWIPEIYRPTP